MRKSSILCLGLSLVLSLTACSNTNTNESQPLKEGDYAAILPYETSTTRVKHVGLFNDLDFRLQIETGLMNLSKDYFDPNEVGYKTHQYLTYDELDATNGSRGLLGTLRDDNPNGLNPTTGEEFDTGNGIAIGPVLLMDAYELDFYSKDKLKGISVSLVMNSYAEVDGENVDITNKQMKSYVEVTCNKMVNFMRSRYNDIGNKIPIYIAIFTVDKKGFGAYAYDTFYQGYAGKCQELQQQYFDLPTSAAREYDEELYNTFVNYREKVSNVLPDSAYVTAEIMYQNKALARMEIHITATGKTAGELLAVSQAAREYLSMFDRTDCRYLVRIETGGETFTLIERDPGTTKTNVISTL
ncbi:MAG: CamS family sex pheromone protein [Firmicutes bacterium]|nr:CamS family sex pheromone protein [Bacillota bacterium]